MKKIILILILILSAFNFLLAKNDMGPKEKALREAVFENDPAKVESLLKEGANPNWKSEYDTMLGSATFFAADKDDFRILDLFFKYKVDVNVGLQDGISALKSMCESSCEQLKASHKVVEYLIQKNALLSEDKGEMLQAAMFGFADTVKVFLKYRDKLSIDINQKDVLGKTTFDWMVSKGKYDVAKLLKELGAEGELPTEQDLLNYKLANAVFKKDVKLIKTLLQKGGNPNSQYIHGIPNMNGDGDLGGYSEGESIFSFAAGIPNNVEIMKLLVKYNADIHLPAKSIPANKWMQTPIFNTLGPTGSLDTKDNFLFLLNLDKTVVNDQDSHGKTPIFEAATLETYFYFIKLVEAGADLLHVNKDGDSVLSNLASISPFKGGSNCGKPEIASDNPRAHMIEYVFNRVNIPKNFLPKAMISAAYSGHLEIMKVLYSHGASFTELGAGIFNIGEIAPIEQAVHMGFVDILRYYLDGDDGASGDANFINPKTGKSLLITAVRNCASDESEIHGRMVNSLFYRGAEKTVNHKDKDGRTALSYAKERFKEDSEVITELKEHGATE